MDLVSAVKSRPFSHLNDKEIATMISNLKKDFVSKPDYQKFQLEKQNYDVSNLELKRTIDDNFIAKNSDAGSYRHNNSVKTSE